MDCSLRAPDLRYGLFLRLDAVLEAAAVEVPGRELRYERVHAVLRVQQQRLDARVAQAVKQSDVQSVLVGLC